MSFDERSAAFEIGRLRDELVGARRENSELSSELAILKRRMEELTATLAEAQRVAARQAAPFRREEQRKIPPGERKRPGRKPGHRGTSRPLPEFVDEEIEEPLRCCPRGGGSVTDRTPLVQFIEEIPPWRPRVTRLVTWRGQRPACGEVRSAHPLQTSTAQGAARVQWGPRALAIAALLNKHLGLTMRKTCRTLAKLFGLSLTPRGLSQALDRLAEKTQGDYDALVGTIHTSAAVYSDETRVSVPQWSLGALVEALQALRGVALVIAVTLVAEVGDMRRFASPKQLMAFLGLTPGEHSSGGSVRPRGITKAGNCSVRTILYEAAWSYRLTPKVGSHMQQTMPRDIPQEAKDIAWKAQLRLCKRYRQLLARGKKSQVAITAVARELLGFIWSIGQCVSPRSEHAAAPIA